MFVESAVQDCRGGAQVDAYLLDLEVEELPGVGWNICQKLKELGIASVRDVRASTKDVLQREIGAKTGACFSGAFTVRSSSGYVVLA